MRPQMIHDEGPAMRPQMIRDRDARRLRTVEPAFAVIVATVLETMDQRGHPMTVTDALRSTFQQIQLWKQGRKLENGIWVPIDPVHRLGIVTNTDGIATKSNHQARDGETTGRAVDCAFLVANRGGELVLPSWSESHPWLMYGELAEELGAGRVKWGGRFDPSARLHDLPHIEWKA